MFLSIFLNYNNKINDLYKTLDSIERIKMPKEIETIIISNEGSVKKDVASKYRHQVKILTGKIKKGALYQKAFSACKSEYITFVNAGDTILYEDVIKTIEIIKKEKPLILKTNLKERYLELNGEIRVADLNTMMIETPRSYFFNAGYLKNNGFEFNEEIEHFVEEDFHRRVFLTNNYAIYSSNTILSDYSVVKIKENMLPIYAENIDELYLSMQECLAFLYDKESINVNLFITRMIFCLYIIIDSFDYARPTLKDKKEKYEKIIYDLYTKYQNEFNSFTDEQKNNIFKVEFERLRRNNIMLRLTESFGDLLYRLKARYEDRNSNNNLIDIIIPEYNGSKHVFNLINSISKQKNVDFSEIGIIVVDDCSTEELNLFKFKRYCNLNIKFIKNDKNLGPGLTRQHGIDESKADYVTFMDCDDEFYDDTSFAKMLAYLREHKPNIARGRFVEELGNGGKKVFKADEGTQFLHGYYFKREFLNENDFRFCDKIRLSEDTYFTTIVLTDNPVVLFDCIVYLWKYNKKSLVRSDDSVELFYRKNLKDLIIGGFCSTEFLENKKSSNVKAAALSSIYAPFILLTSYVFEDFKDKKTLEEYEKELYKSYFKHKKYFDEASEEEKNNEFNKVLESLKRSLPGITSLENLDSFMNRMKDKHPNI